MTKARRLTFSGLDFVAIAIGGVFGATVRWLAIRTDDVEAGWFAYAPETNAALSTSPAIPADTLLVNLIGCLLLGGLTVLLARPASIPRRWLVAASTGFCGSLTTFAGVAVEVASLLRNEPLPYQGFEGASLSSSSAVTTGLLYLALSLIGGGSAFYAGRTATTRVVSQTASETEGPQ